MVLVWAADTTAEEEFALRSLNCTHTAFERTLLRSSERMDLTSRRKIE